MHLHQQVFADLALSQRLERAEGLSCQRFVEARARVAPTLGACSATIGGTHASFDGADSPVTQTFGLGVLNTLTVESIEAAEAFFRERGAPVFHEVSPLAGVELQQFLIDRGYKPIELTAVMYQPISTVAAGRESVGTIRARTIDPQTVSDRLLWAQTMAGGWAETPELRAFLFDTGSVIAWKQNSPAFLAELDGKAIAAASMSMEDGVALLAGACTIPEFRNRGAQRALLNARLAFAREWGCDLAMMCAAPGSSSQRNAERNGFRIAYTRTKWMLPA